jgi:hypothetical protein
VKEGDGAPHLSSLLMDQERAYGSWRGIASHVVSGDIPVPSAPLGSLLGVAWPEPLTLVASRRLVVAQALRSAHRLQPLDQEPDHEPEPTEPIPFEPGEEPADHVDRYYLVLHLDGWPQYRGIWSGGSDLATYDFLLRRAGGLYVTSSIIFRRHDSARLAVAEYHRRRWWYGLPLQPRRFGAADRW